jgi:SSS family solute:Na+ symporter
MNLNSLDFILIAAYFLGLVAFGVLVRRIRGFSDFAVGSRAVPFSMIFASLSAAYIGPGYTMGFTAKGYETGFLFFFVVLAFTLQTTLVALFLAPKLHRFQDCHTIGDVIGRLYGKGAHVVSGFISFALCTGFVAIIGKVGGNIAHGATGVPVVVGIFLVTGVGVLYSYTGGIKSVIATEALQFAIFAIAVPLLLWFTLKGSHVDLAAATASGWEATHKAWSGMNGIQILGLFLSFFLGETLIPPYANRALASDSEKTARSGFLAGAGYSVIWFGMVVGLGVAAQGILADAKPDDVFMTLAVKYLPHGLLGLLIVAIMAIIMSSQESILNAGAVSLTKDLVGKLRRGEMTDSARLRFSRFATFAMGVLAGIMAIASPSIIDGLLMIYALWAPSVLPILVLGLLLPRVPVAAGLPAMVAGGATSAIWQFWLKEPAGIPALLIGLVVNFAVYGLVALVSKERNSAA